jgi:3-oxoadipate enol-lactonase
MPKVKVGDINMYYEVHGKGEPLVFINGIGANISTMLPRIQLFSREYKVVGFDNRGAGRSDAPPIPYTAEMMADDLAGLLEIIGIVKAHIFGASLGGGIAQVFALRHPKKVISLILACTSCTGPHSIPSDPAYIKLTTDPTLLKLPPEERTKLLIPFMVSQEFIDKNPTLMQQFLVKRDEYPASPQGLAGQRQVSQGHGTYERLPEIVAPTLVIHGDSDRIIPMENARILASRIPGAELVILKRAGHMLMEADNEFNRVMLDFLRRHSTKKA